MIKTINGEKDNKHGKKNLNKIKIDIDDELPLNKLVNLLSMTVIMRSVFEEDGKLYSQTFLDEYLYES